LLEIQNNKIYLVVVSLVKMVCAEVKREERWRQMLKIARWKQR